MSAISNYLIMGATGRQGSAVLAALLTHPTAKVAASQVYAVTRNSSSVSSQRLTARHPGLHLIQGVLSEPIALLQQLPEEVLTKTAIFLMLPDEPALQTSQGPAFIDAARTLSVPHIVFSSVDRGPDSDIEPSFVPQFESLYKVEQHLKSVASSSLGELTYTIIRPTFFMDNFQWGFLGKVVAVGVRDHLKGMKHQMVATRDIGRWAAEALLFSDDRQFKDQGFSITSDALTFEEANENFARNTGQPIPITFGLLGNFIIYVVPPVNKLFKWFHDRPSQVEIAALSKRIKPTTFEQWAAGVAAGKQ